MPEDTVAKLILAIVGVLFSSGGFLWLIAQSWAVRAKAQAALTQAQAALIRAQVAASEAEARATDVETDERKVILDALKRSQENTANTLQLQMANVNAGGDKNALRLVIVDLSDKIDLLNIQHKLENEQITALSFLMAPRDTPDEIATANATHAANIANDSAAALPPVS